MFLQASECHSRGRWGPGAVLVLLALSFSGCASGGYSNPFEEGTARDYYQIRVESRSSYDVSIYVEVGNRRELLATIRPRSIQLLEFQHPVGRPLRLELESMLGERYRVPPGTAQGGGRVDLIILENIRRSAFIRR
ncbi:MAG: hypothetical protein PVJ76_08165 [Gemmatimonadota bacterium]